jgi:O-succinylbenzoate synthase
LGPRSQKLGVPLWRHLGGTRAEIECGVSIGIQDSVEQLFEKIQTELDAVIAASRSRSARVGL